MWHQGHLVLDLERDLVEAEGREQGGRKEMR